MYAALANNVRACQSVEWHTTFGANLLRTRHVWSEKSPAQWVIDGNSSMCFSV